MKLFLKIWKQNYKEDKGKFKTYVMENLSSDISFLEMLDLLNEKLILEKSEMVSFDSDCREGICGMCGIMINGRAHGEAQGSTVCQLHLRKFKDGDTIWVEPWRARAFPIVKDLVVDRKALDNVMSVGGYISVNIGSAPDANAVAVAKYKAEEAMDAAQCIGCGACVAACKNAAAMLFVGAKVSHLAVLPQGSPEREKRVLEMVDVMDKMGFGNCTNEEECQKACPKEIDVRHIARMNREWLRAKIKE